MFTKEGYIDFNYVLKDRSPFIFIVGGRGSGKTYGAIKYALDNDRKFFFMRRTQTQIDLIKNDSFSPFKVVDESVVVSPINKNLTGIYRGSQNSDGTWSSSGAPIGYMCALSTISNIRGFDASDVELIIYDEFIGEAHERPIRNEGQAFLNAYETINRNRELNGREPVQLLALANSNSLANPLFVELQLVTPVEKLMRSDNSKKFYRYTNQERGVSVYMVNSSPVLEAKQRTALYKLSGDSEFSAMALHNEFTAEEMDHIKTQDLKPYRLICCVGEICAYKKKDNTGYYITGHKSGSTEAVYQSTSTDLKRFRRDQYFLWLAYLNGRILFESYIYKVLFEKYFGI
ncbi:phage DNA encapsidation protein [Ruminococcus sp.]|uniref:phage DNA encapsidation protein n=1 Tax=Ruminococcus sp. TaxID=41978 RepID=UPI001B614574|nr:phage DNA encapsidation protein [Ruminococcus sp.]MBP5433236.1 phage DNA encapsidation protein [Ruminococcus sp.]